MGVPYEVQVLHLVDVALRPQQGAVVEEGVCLGAAQFGVEVGPHGVVCVGHDRDQEVEHEKIKQERVGDEERPVHGAGFVWSDGEGAGK